MDNPKWMPYRPFPLNLQRFADGANSGAGEGGEDNGGAESGADGNTTQDKSKTFSQEDVNAIAAREAKKAREKLLKEFGIDPTADPKALKERLGKLQTYEDGQKTDLEKATGSMSKLTSERDAANARAIAAERKAAALMGGVPADKVDRYIKLAESYMDGEDADFGEAIAAALKDFPVVQVEEKRGSAGAGANPGAGGNGGKAESNPGREAAELRKAQSKRSNEALKSYMNR